MSTEIVEMAQDLAPGLDWRASDDGTYGLPFAAASIGLIEDECATVNLAHKGGEWIAELVIRRSREGYYPVGATVHCTAATARAAWTEMLTLCGRIGSARLAAEWYADHFAPGALPDGA